jgi:hypothetical protein
MQGLFSFTTKVARRRLSVTLQVLGLSWVALFTCTLRLIDRQSVQKEFRAKCLDVRSIRCLAVGNVVVSICSFPPVYLAIDSNNINISHTTAADLCCELPCGSTTRITGDLGNIYKFVI